MVKKVQLRVGFKRKLAISFIAANITLALGASVNASNGPLRLDSGFSEKAVSTNYSPERLYQELTTAPTPLPQSFLDLSTLPHVPDIDILSINDEIKSVLDRSISHIKDKRHRAVELHRLLFKPMFLGIVYDYESTLTAQETFDQGKGNCLSHAALYVAAARYVGLNAKFQVVEVPREWLDKDQFYVVPGHINVSVKVPGNKITVEFADAFAARVSQHFKSTEVSDKKAFAEYYNNLAMLQMEKGDYASAIAYMRKSIDINKRIGSVWSNLGVAYKITGHLDLAEQAYLNGLKHDKRNLSIINNTYILYRQTGRHEAAAKFARKVERYSKHNPYYLEKLAVADMSLGDYKSAIALLRKAAKIKPMEAKFHIELAYAYHQLGDYENSIKSATKAQQNATSDGESEGYQAKLKLLREMRAGL
ncbi:Tfp pilus assembly protein PilF [Alteromonadaceae bacterium Bs31]|nr:Tfp pilus assembly protein PilF [Alteromonadaceae bacterium Bs31]